MGSLLASGGFFLLPLLIVIPNPQAVKSISFQLLSLEGDYRYLVLFLLSISPFAVAFQENPLRRGWVLVGLGSLIMILTVWLTGIAAQDLQENALTILPEDTFIRNPRVRPVSAVAVGLAGGYLVLFGGLTDLRKMKVSQGLQLIASTFSLVVIYWLFRSGRLDSLSIVVEYGRNGEGLIENVVKQFSYVAVALVAGLVIGIGLGFWASRQERVAPIILYIVGIIQTIPSLALFGLLLVPLSNLGRQEILNDILIIVLPALIVLGGLGFGVIRFGGNALPERLQFWLLIAIGTLLVIPILVLTLMSISLLFQLVFRMLSVPEFNELKYAFVGLALLSLVFNNLVRQITIFRQNSMLRHRVRQVLLFVLFALGLVIFGLTANEYLPTDQSLNTWVLGDIGIRGLGETPSIIALSLYSLLPLVRNTYTGLNNVDNAIIDSGRGMGMTKQQIFFKIELPLAFPIIMAGVRNAAIALVGIATIAHVVGGGALGEYVIEGANRISLDLILLGTIPAIMLAFAMDAGLRSLESILTSPGIRQLR